MTDSDPGMGTEPPPDPKPSASVREAALRRRRWMLWVWFGIAVFVIGGGAATLAYFTVRSGGVALARLGVVEENLAALEGDLAAIQAGQADIRAAMRAAEVELGMVEEQAAEAVAKAGAARAAAAGAVMPRDVNAMVAALDLRVANVAQALGALGARVDNVAADGALGERVADLEAAVAGGIHAESANAAPQPVDAGLSRRVAAVERAIAGLRTAPAAEVAAAAAVAAVELRLLRRLRAAEDRITEIERAVSALGAAGSGARSALIVATAQLQAQLRTSQDFADHLATVRLVVEGEYVNDPAFITVLAELDVFAAGVPTVGNLARQFSPLAGSLVVVGAGEVGGGWGAALWMRMRSAVTVRRTGEVEGVDTEARVARAEARLERGDLARAVAEVAELEGLAASVAAPWLADARARLAVDAAADRLRARMLAAIAGFEERAP